MPLMRRRPLLRAAAVGGGAYAVGKRRARTEQHEASQDEQIAQQQPQSYAPPAPQYDAPPASPPSQGLSAEAMAQLAQLGQLHDSGILTDEEFAEQKQRLLA